jgi:hypothetical protein
MNTITIAAYAYMVDLLPRDSQSRLRSPSPRPDPNNPGIKALEDGLALPSFWTVPEIRDAFTLANAKWDQAKISFNLVTVASREEVVPADGDGMWRTLVNRLRPPSGIAVAFVFDLPSDEGGWGGGHHAVIGGAKAIGAITGYQGGILAHELGHILLGIEHDDSPSNLMVGRRHPRIVYADQLTPEQIETARVNAQKL